MALYYTDTADLLSVMPQYLRDQLLDDDHDGSEDVGLAQQVLEDSESYVDMYLSARYAVPLTDSQLRTARLLTLRAARYFAHLRLNTVDDRIERDYEQLTRELEMVASGKLERAQGHEEKATGRSRIGSADRVFSRESLRGL